MTNATVESATKLADEFDKWQAELTSLLSELAHKDGADGARAEGLGQFLPTLRAAIAALQAEEPQPEHERNAARYIKLRGWMSSNVEEGWREVEHLGALAAWESWDAFEMHLDSLPPCNVGLMAKALSATPPKD